MIKPFSDNQKPNLKTKIFIMLFFFFTIMYLVDKFFDAYTLVMPVEIKIKSPIEKRQPPKNVKNLPKNSPKQRGFETTALKAKNEQISHISLNEPYEAIYVYFGEDKIAHAIAKAESGYKCDSISKTKDYGLFQINQVHLWRFEKFRGNPFNCWDNAKVAYEIYKEQGWRPWVVFQNERYLKYL